MTDATLTYADARALASQYHSPGPVGRTFAAFASGHLVSYEDFITECEMTATEVGFESHADMAALRDFAESTDIPVWTDRRDPDDDDPDRSICCGATFKGTDYGTVCRACYRPAY